MDAQEAGATRQGGQVQEPGPASGTARSNEPCEARRHKDSGEEVELEMCNEET